MIQIPLPIHIDILNKQFKSKLFIHKLLTKRKSQKEKIKLIRSFYREVLGISKITKLTFELAWADIYQTEEWEIFEEIFLTQMGITHSIVARYYSETDGEWIKEFVIFKDEWF